MTSVIEREQELLKLAETRGARRAGIIRKAATRDLKRLRRQTKGAADAAADSTAEALGSDAEDGCAILREVVVTADPALFVESKHSHAWSRCEGKAYHLARLKHIDNPLSRRVVEWEQLEEQPLEFLPSSTVKDAWKHRDVDASEVPYGDPDAFRDLDAIAIQHDFYSGAETRFKLASCKPPAHAPQHAGCVVNYKSCMNADRVLGSVVYDASGRARVDVNFQHHRHVENRFEVPSGHWHVLSPGDHTHNTDLEEHHDWQHAPWLWLAIPKAFEILPLVPVGC